MYLISKRLELVSVQLLLSVGDWVAIGLDDGLGEEDVCVLIGQLDWPPLLLLLLLLAAAVSGLLLALLSFLVRHGDLT